VWQVRAECVTGDRPPAAASTLTRVPIEFTTSLDGVVPAHLASFFEGWPNPPSPERHLDILRGSYRICLAREASSPQIVGFVNAISDGVLYAFIPLLEVLPAYRGRGIGSELVTRVLGELDDFYAVDLMCDPELQPFYERFGMHRATGMIIRRR
jgi:ribosomal protein S18 acetylase RimI-like enzyme